MMESATRETVSRDGRVAASLETTKTAEAEDVPKPLKRTDSPLELLSPTITPTPQPLSRNSSTTSSRFSLFRSPSSSKPLPMAPNSALTDLQAALAKETQARIAAEQKAQKAEAKVREVQDEIEDLSVTLFEEANEMVAKERREKAVLEERIKDLEGRERDRKRRLERLEQALGRIERVRKLLDG